MVDGVITEQSRLGQGRTACMHACTAVRTAELALGVGMLRMDGWREKERLTRNAAALPVLIGGGLAIMFGQSRFFIVAIVVDKWELLALLLA